MSRATKPEAPRLSVCLIVRDEAALLPGCLDSVTGVADEIVACDTGSIDGTLDILRPRVDRLIEKPWRDDFAVARNAALELATGDWILCLDADERLCSDGVDALRLALTDPHVLAYRVPVVDRYAADPLAATDAFETDSCTGALESCAGGGVPILRLFRNRPDIRYTGRIHEQVAPAVVEVVAREPHWKVRLLPGAIIEHLGYDPAVKDQQRGRERNFALLRRELASDPDNPYLNYKLYQTDPSWSGAAAALFRAAEFVLALPQPRLRRLGYGGELLTAATVEWQRRGELDAAERAARAALEHFPEVSAPHLVLALVLESRNRPDAALAELDAFFRKEPAAMPHAFDPRSADLTARLARARLLSRAKRADQALTVLERTARDHPDAAVVPIAIAETLLELGRPADVLQRVVPLLERLPSRELARICAQAAEAIGDGAAAAELRRLAGEG